VALDRPGDRHGAAGRGLRGAPAPPVRPAAGGLGSGPGAGSGEPAMPELLEPAAPGGGDRALSESVVRSPKSVAPKPAPEAEALPLRTTDYGPRTQPVLLFDRVSKWYGPVIGVNGLTLELRPGITGLV